MRVVCPRVLSLLLGLVFATSALAQQFNPDDVSSPEAIVAATYKSIERAPGEAYDWDRFRSLFLPEALMVPNAEQTGGTTRILTPQDFVDWANRAAPAGQPNDQGFAEEIVHNEIHRFGDIAQVFSTYQKRFYNDERILGRGINSFQLLFRDDRWWIVSIIWDEEVGAGPIPARYLGDG
ncbi:MAG: hypothetical protein RhofKO_18630 [Rhodothermales bacterium]